MMTSLARWCYPYGRTRRVLRGPARGTRFIVRPAMAAAYALAFADATSPFLWSKIKPGMTVFDVGANKGQMALLFAALVGPKGLVVSLEPAPQEFERFVRNLALNPGVPIRAIHAAAAAARGSARFAYSPDRATEGRLDEAAGGVDVRTIPLDDLLMDGAVPDVMKIDVEGGAFGVLDGAARILDEHAPSVYIELHSPGEQMAVRERLLSRGYIAETLDAARVENPSEGWHNPLWCYHPQRRR
jgi:FkbM family methyltransferase